MKTALIALCLGFFMVIMDVTIVNVALPNIAIKLNASISWLQWIVDAYTLAFACLLLMAGHMSDQWGAKKLYQLAVLGFIATSFFCGLANSPWSLTFFRLLQGASAAFLVPTSLALIHGIFKDNKAKAKAIGLWGATGGVAAASGPVLGGVLTSFFDWRAVFFVNIPIGLICFFMTKKINFIAPLKKVSFDIAGQGFAILSIAALAFSLIETGRFAWFSAIVVTSFCVFILALILFINTELHSKSPMLPLKLLREPSFSSVLLIGLLMNLGFYGILFILPLYFQHTRHYSILATGFALLPLMITSAFSSYLSGKITSRLGPKKPMMVGSIISAIGFLSLLIAGNHTPSYWILILPLAWAGFGIAFTMPAATVMAIQSVSQNRAGLATGAFTTSRQIGSLLGVAIFGSVIANASSFVIGMRIDLIFAGSVFLLACLVTKIFIKH